MRIKNSFYKEKGTENCNPGGGLWTGEEHVNFNVSEKQEREERVGIWI